MPVVPGKPGSIKIRGVTRAQCRRLRATCVSLLNYNTKAAAMVPPVIFLNELNLASINAARAAAQSLLDLRNT